MDWTDTREQATFREEVRELIARMPERYRRMAGLRYHGRRLRSAILDEIEDVLFRHPASLAAAWNVRDRDTVLRSDLPDHRGRSGSQPLLCRPWSAATGGDRSGGRSGVGLGGGRIGLSRGGDLIG